MKKSPQYRVTQRSYYKQRELTNESGIFERFSKSFRHSLRRSSSEGTPTYYVDDSVNLVLGELSLGWFCCL